jgi:hypothetical protein
VAKRKALSLSALENKLDRIFSEWVRKSSADEGGTVECVTCQKLMHWTGGDAQAGHFVKRQHRATRWDARNVNVQCVRCNQWLGGNEGEHGAYIIRTHGLDVHNELLRLKRTTKKFNRVELEDLIVNYKQKLNELDKPSSLHSPTQAGTQTTQRRDDSKVSNSEREEVSLHEAGDH